MQNTNWDDFRFILAVVEHGSLNAAARALGVNHATVLRRVSGFEARFGVEIFQRNVTGYRVHADQSELKSILSAVKSALEQAERTLLGQVASLGGPLKLTSTDSLCDVLLPEIVARLSEKYPEIKTTLLASNSHMNLAGLEAEITVRPAVKLPSDLRGTFVGMMGMAAYKSLKMNAEIGNSWLGCSPLIAQSPAGKWLVENVSAHNIVAEADSFLTLRNMCAAGLGYAILPCCIVQPHHGLLRDDEATPRLETRVWVANHKDLDTVPRIAAAHAFLAEHLANQAPLMAG